VDILSTDHTETDFWTVKLLLNQLPYAQKSRMIVSHGDQAFDLAFEYTFDWKLHEKA
jgi:hypothetical protein